MKVKLYDSQLDRTIDTGGKPITTQLNPNIFAQLGGASSDIGKAVFQLGVEKLRYDKANEKINNENQANQAVLSFKDEAQTLLRKLELTGDPTTNDVAGPDAIKKTFNKYRNLLKDNKGALALYMNNAGRLFIDLKHEFLDKNLTKKIELGKTNTDNAVLSDIDIASNIGNITNNRIDAVTNAETKLENAKGLYGNEHPEVVQKFYYNLIENTITSMLNGSNNPDQIALEMQDEEYFEQATPQTQSFDSFDPILSAYYKKLNSDQKIKIQEFANKKSDEILKARENAEKRDEEEFKKNIDALKSQFINSDDSAEKQKIYEQIKDLGGFTSIKDRDDFEKELTVSDPSNANSIYFADKDDEKALSEFWVEDMLGTVSQADLLDNERYGKKFTSKTFEKLKKHLNTELKEDEAISLAQLKYEMKISEGYEEVFEPSIRDAVFTTSSPYLAEFAEFRKTNPSKKELEAKVKDIITRYNNAKVGLFGTAYEDELVSIKARLLNNSAVTDAIDKGEWDLSKYDSNPIEALGELIGLLDSKGVARVNINLISENLKTLKGYKKILP
jgi:hypothetical protein